jgi:uncharacterized membrane protein YkvA (DUF1232 family)
VGKVPVSRATAQLVTIFRRACSCNILSRNYWQDADQLCTTPVCPSCSESSTDSKQYPTYARVTKVPSIFLKLLARSTGSHSQQRGALYRTNAHRPMLSLFPVVVAYFAMGALFRRVSLAIGELWAVQRQGANMISCKAWWEARKSRLRRDIVFINKQVRLLSMLLRRPEVPWPAKLAGGCAIAYIFSPIQLIPTFIPVIGQLDDLVVLLVGTKIVRRFTPSALLSECELRAEQGSVMQVERWERALS